MDQLIANLNTKIEFLNTLIKAFQQRQPEMNTEPYSRAVEITQRALLLTKRIHRLRYTICRFISIVEHIRVNKDANINVASDIVFDYEVYLNTICIELCILLGLSESGGSADNPNRIFNDAMKLNKESAELNLHNTFLSIKGYVPAFKDAVKKLKQFKSNNSVKLQDIKDIRDKYAAHHDFDFNKDTIDTNVVILGFIELTNVWYEMCKSIGAIFENREYEIKKWTIEDYQEEIARIYKLSFNTCNVDKNSNKHSTKSDL